MEEPIVVGLDIGTSKICTLVARIENGANLRILGVGVEPSQGIRKGVVIDINSASQSIARSIEKAERTSGYEINSALVSLAGSHVSSMNSRGVVGISGRVIDQEDVLRALDSAQAVAIPHDREIIHVIQRGFLVDGQDGIRQPVGMHGFRLEVEAHIIPLLLPPPKTYVSAFLWQGLRSHNLCSAPWHLPKLCFPRPNALWVRLWLIWAAAQPT